MTFGESVRTVVLEKYATFTGRAIRSEFWWFQLFSVGLGLLMGVLGLITGMVAIFDGIDSLISLILLIPTIAVTCRRLHDTNRSGWWQLLPLLGLAPILLLIATGSAFTSPLIIIFGIVTAGLVVLLIYWLAQTGDVGENRFGSDPFGNTDAEIFS